MDKDKANRRLFQAAKHGNVADAQAALDVGADVNATDEYARTPLHFAAAAGSLATVELLIERGACADARDHTDRSPMSFAKQHYFSDICEELKEAAANQQQGHAGRVTEERKDKGPPQVGG